MKDASKTNLRWRHSIACPRASRLESTQLWSIIGGATDESVSDSGLYPLSLDDSVSYTGLYPLTVNLEYFAEPDTSFDKHGRRSQK
jgi:hypothetical protein